MKNNLHPSTFFTAVILSILLLAAYEWYWRNIDGRVPGYDDNAEMWAYWRGKVDDLSSRDVVILGSSRAHFDINIHLFDSLTGRRPITLAVPGGSPYYTLEDIVTKTNFNGLLIIGVAPGLFYTVGTGGAAMWIKEGRVDYYYKQTYASKFSQAAYSFIDPLFGYLDPDISLQSLVTRIPFPERDSVETPPAWPPMVHMDKYRNIRMNERFETDTVLQNQQTKIWDGDWKNRYTDSVEVILTHYASLVNTFIKRGGRAVFIQPPVTGKYLQYEPVLFPRDQYWNVLLQKANVKGYCYEDYPEMKAMNPPEWSHLNRKEADQYTRILVRLLKQDGLLP